MPKWVVMAIFAGACASPAAAQDTLPMGAPRQGRVPNRGAAEFAVAAKTAGVLVVATTGDADLVLQVTDSDGQGLEDGRSDQDLNGSMGTEMVSVVAPEPGSYRVRVTTNDGSAAGFEIAGSWMSFPAFEQKNTDPDRRPSSARAGEIGRAIEDSVDSDEGDNWDWFVLTPKESGTLAIALRRRSGGGDADLQLEAFLNGNFAEPVQRSDQDLQDDSANESVMVNVNAGQAVHLKVSRVFSDGSTGYTLSSSLLP
jgi:hypothetical protein